MNAAATIVIPQRNGAALTLACIESLRATDPVCWPVIVVDDGSDAVEREGVERCGVAGVRVIAQEGRGVSAAWNRGAELAATPLIVFLNNDVLFRGPAVGRLVRAIDLGALVAGARRRIERRLPERVLAQLPTRTFLEGWCFALRRDDFVRVGGFDEAMRVYWSDSDLQCRLLKTAGRDGRSLVCVERLSVRHLGHRTTRQLVERRAQWKADRKVFIEKWRDGVFLEGDGRSDSVLRVPAP